MCGIHTVCCLVSCYLLCICIAVLGPRLQGIGIGRGEIGLMSFGFCVLIWVICVNSRSSVVGVLCGCLVGSVEDMLFQVEVGFNVFEFPCGWIAGLSIVGVHVSNKHTSCI